MKNIKISRKTFNKNNPLIIAEIGQAHEGSEGLVHSMIDALCEVECDAIKFQIHLADLESLLGIHGIFLQVNWFCKAFNRDMKSQTA